MTGLPYLPTTTTILKPDPNTKEVVAVTTQDVEPILEHAATLRSMPQKSDWGRHIASVPNNLINELLEEEWRRGNPHASPYSPEIVAKVKQRLDSGEWAKFRVDEKVSGGAYIGWHK